MNDGDNPKNISRINDWWDDDQKAQVNYAGWVGGSGDLGYTGDVLLTDSDYNDIGEEYPAGTETIYVQVYDSDVTGSLDVLLTSTTDTEGETVTLTEVSDLPGTFRGSISTVNASRVLVDEDLLEERIVQLRLEYPDHDDELLRTRARGQLIEEAISNPPATSSFRSDGVIQAIAGDIVTVTYDDVLNDYGNAETLVTTAVYGGWSGSVSGTWTAAGSPYVVTGDLYVDRSISYDRTWCRCSFLWWTIIFMYMVL